MKETASIAWTTRPTRAASDDCSTFHAWASLERSPAAWSTAGPVVNSWMLLDEEARSQPNGNTTAGQHTAKSYPH
jgi:hypothetical protein